VSRLTLAERLRLRRLRSGRQRATGLRSLASAFVGTRRAPVADSFTLVPQEIRATDPAFASELAAGYLGLAGRTLALQGRSPFDLEAPDEAWRTALHGFGWLGHMKANGSAEAGRRAAGLVREWVVRHRGERGEAFAPDVVGRRVMSWIANADFLAEHATDAEFDALAQSLTRQIRRLEQTWAQARVGQPCIEALSGLVLADIAVEGREQSLVRSQQLLMRELSRQIMRDGGHVSRNPAVLLEMLLDLVPIRHAYAARRLEQPESLEPIMSRMAAMLRYLRLGDGSLARFNGAGAHRLDELATVLSYDRTPEQELAAAEQSGYFRLRRGPTLLLVDAGAGPPIEHAGAATASALAFELSSGRSLLLAGRGHPALSSAPRASGWRLTPSFNTLAIDGQSSGNLVPAATLEGLVADAAMRGPASVRASLDDGEGNCRLAMSHNGYLDRFGLLHRRELTLRSDGRGLSGIDRLEPPRGSLRLKRDLPFAVHFHLAPGVEIEAEGVGRWATLIAPDCQRWTILVTGATLEVEEDTDAHGRHGGLQFVLRAATFGESEVAWTIEAET
jgi:uncharacterized heparinase superfamily protein